MITISSARTFRSRAAKSSCSIKRKTELRNVGCHGYGVARDLGITAVGQVDWRATYTLLQALPKQARPDLGVIVGTRSATTASKDMDHVQRILCVSAGADVQGEFYPPRPRPLRRHEGHNVAGV